MRFLIRSFNLFLLQRGKLIKKFKKVSECILCIFYFLTNRHFYIFQFLPDIIFVFFNQNIFIFRTCLTETCPICAFFGASSKLDESAKLRRKAATRCASAGSGKKCSTTPGWASLWKSKKYMNNFKVHKNIDENW